MDTSGLPGEFQLSEVLRVVRLDLCWHQIPRWQPMTQPGWEVTTNARLATQVRASALPIRIEIHWSYNLSECFPNISQIRVIGNYCWLLSLIIWRFKLMSFHFTAFAYCLRVAALALAIAPRVDQCAARGWNRRLLELVLTLHLGGRKFVPLKFPFF